MWATRSSKSFTGETFRRFRFLGFQSFLQQLFIIRLRGLWVTALTAESCPHFPMVNAFSETGRSEPRENCGQLEARKVSPVKLFADSDLDLKKKEETAITVTPPLFIFSSYASEKQSKLFCI